MNRYAKIALITLPAIGLFVAVKVSSYRDAQERKQEHLERVRKDSIRVFKNDSVARYTDSIVNAYPPEMREEMERRKKEYTEATNKAIAELTAYKWEIKVRGYNNNTDIELIGLDDAFNAVYVYANSGGESVKKGSWQLKSPDEFVLNIRGNTGIISETYIKKNGVWRSGDNYLERFID